MLPSDSTFAVAMKNQQQAEREEQQRIKNLVLNYDLRESEDLDGDTLPSPLKPNTNIHRSNHAGHEKSPPYHTNRSERLNRERGGQRIRRLELKDVDWYAPTHRNNNRRKEERQDSYVADVMSARGRFDDKDSSICSPVESTMLDKRRKHTDHRRRPCNQFNY